MAIERELLAAHRSSKQIPEGTTVGAKLRKPITNAAQRTKRPFAKRKRGRSPNKGKQKELAMKATARNLNRAVTSRPFSY